MITNSKVLIVPHWGLGDLIYYYGLVKYIAEQNIEVKYLVKNSYIEPGSIIYRDLSNVSFYGVPDTRWPVFNRMQLEHAFPGFIILMLGYHAGHDVDISIYPLSFYDDTGVPRSMLWAPYKMHYSEESIKLYEEIRDISYAFIDTFSSSGHLFDANTAIAHLGINTESILTINLHKNIYPMGHRFYDIAQKMMEKRPITDYVCILENASYLILSDSAVHALCHLLHIKSINNYVICRHKHIPNSFVTIYDENVYTDSRPTMRVKFIVLNL